MSKPPNIFPRNGVYYYRRRVPRDLVEHLGRREIKKSLKTGSNAEARVRGNLAACDFDRLFAEARKARSLGSSATGSRVASYDSREARSIIHKYVELTSSEQLRELQNIDLHGDDELHADLGGEAAEIVSDLSESSRIYTRQSIYALERELFGPDGVKLQNPTERPDIETLLRLGLLEIGKRNLAYLRGKLPTGSFDARFAGPLETRPTLQQVANEYFTEYEITHQNIGPKRRNSIRSIIEIITSFFGPETLINHIDQNYCREFRGFLDTIPSNMYKFFPDRSHK